MAVRVLLAAIGGVDVGMLARVAERASKLMPVKSEWLVATERFNPPISAFDWDRLQYRADSINVNVYESFRSIAESGVKIVAVVEGDGYVGGMNFVFGLATPSLGVASVYTGRLGKGSLLEERLVKEVLHELGHLLGLGHCSNKRCVMSFSLSVADVDAKGAEFCGRCAAKLRSAMER